MSARADGAGPIRMCAGCRERAPQAELVRLVAGPDGLALDDPGRRTQARGAYLHRMYACWQAAARRRAVERGLRVRPGAVGVAECRERFDLLGPGA